MNIQTGELEPLESFAFDESVELLVLNELSDSEQRDLIRQLNDIEGGWKRCAIAFIENQRLGNALCAVANGIEATVEFVSTDLRTQPDSQLDCVPAIAGRPQANSVKNSRKDHLIWALAATAALVVGFLFGKFNGENPPPDKFESNEMASTEGLLPPNALTEEVKRKIAWAHTAVGEEDFQVVAMLQAKTESGDRYFPIVTSSRLAETLDALPQPGLSPGASAQLKKEGWQIDKHRQLLSMQMPDGKCTLTPLDLFNCRYVGKAVY